MNPAGDSVRTASVFFTGLSLALLTAARSQPARPLPRKTMHPILEHHVVTFPECQLRFDGPADFALRLEARSDAAAANAVRP